MVKQSESENSIHLYYVYAHADGIFSHELDKHLVNLQRQGIIVNWHSREITPETDGKYTFEELFNTAKIILLLISPDFLSFDFCYGAAMQHAIDRHNAGEAIIIPIIVRPVDRSTAPFDKLSVLPDNEEPITTWLNQDEAYFNIVEGIQNEIILFRNKKNIAYEPVMILSSEQETTSSIKLHYIYNGLDQNLCNQLEKHLSILQQQGFISQWTRKNILQEEIMEDENNLSTAKIILLLISPDFLASDFLDYTEIQRVFERQQTGEITAISVILRPTYLDYPPFNMLPVLPTDSKPITSWSDIDSAFVNVFQGIRNIITETSSFPSNLIKEEQRIDTEEMLKHVPIASGPIKIFYSYAHKDEALLQRLLTHLTALRRQAYIVDFYDRLIQAGQQWEPTIDRELHAAHIILLLISADYLASDYCVDVQMPVALRRAIVGEAVVIPIIMRPVHWMDSPINILAPLPTEGKPASSWENLDAAFYDIAEGIRKVVLSLATRLQQETKEQLILEGEKYYHAHDYDAALALYKHALSIDPKDEFVSSFIGRILIQLERYEDALNVYEDLLRLSSTASAYLFKGVALQHLGRLTDALNAYQKARELGFSG